LYRIEAISLFFPKKKSQENSTKAKKTLMKKITKRFNSIL